MTKDRKILCELLKYKRRMFQAQQLYKKSVKNYTDSSMYFVDLEHFVAVHNCVEIARRVLYDYPLG